MCKTNKHTGTHSHTRTRMSSTDNEIKRVFIGIALWITCSWIFTKSVQIFAFTIDSICINKTGLHKQRKQISPQSSPGWAYACTCVCLGCVRAAFIAHTPRCHSTPRYIALTAGVWIKLKRSRQLHEKLENRASWKHEYIFTCKYLIINEIINDFGKNLVYCFSSKIFCFAVVNRFFSQIFLNRAEKILSLRVNFFHLSVRSHATHGDTLKLFCASALSYCITNAVKSCHKLYLAQ